MSCQTAVIHLMRRPKREMRPARCTAGTLQNSGDQQKLPCASALLGKVTCWTKNSNYLEFSPNSNTRSEMMELSLQNSERGEPE